jgi:hypothetical protein
LPERKHERERERERERESRVRISIRFHSRRRDQWQLLASRYILRPGEDVRTTRANQMSGHNKQQERETGREGEREPEKRERKRKRRFSKWQPTGGRQLMATATESWDSRRCHCHRFAPSLRGCTRYRPATDVREGGINSNSVPEKN